MCHLKAAACALGAAVSGNRLSPKYFPDAPEGSLQIIPYLQ